MRYSVVILNWNGRHFLEECLASVLSQTFPDFEVILVDNGSTDGSAEFVRDRFGDSVRLVTLPENTGYAGGNNRGIAVARGDWIVLLNNDTQVPPDWLQELSAAGERHPDIQVFACKVMNYYRRDEIDNVGHLLYPDGINRGRGRLERDEGQYDWEEEVLFPSGCAAAYRKDLLEATGGFDESFFAYGDDTDLGLRARFHGARCILAPKAVVYHKYSGTAGSYSEFKAYLVERNRIWVLLKYFPLRWILLSPFFTIMRMFNHLLAGWRGKGASGRFMERGSVFDLVRIVLRAHRDALSRLPEIWKERNAIRSAGKVTAKEFSVLLKRFRLPVRDVAWKE